MAAGRAGANKDKKDQLTVILEVVGSPEPEELAVFHAAGAQSRTEDEVRAEMRSAKVAQNVLRRWRRYMRLRRMLALIASVRRIAAAALPPLPRLWRRKLARAFARRSEEDALRRRATMMHAVSSDRASPRYADRLKSYLTSLSALSEESAVCPVCADVSALSAAQAVVTRGPLNFNATEFVPKMRHVKTPGHEAAERAFQAYHASLLSKGVPALERCRDAVASINVRAAKLTSADTIEIIDARDLVQACHDALLRDASEKEDVRDWAGAQSAVMDAAENILPTVAQAMERAEALFMEDEKRRAAEEMVAEAEVLEMEDEEDDEEKALMRLAKAKQGSGKGGGGKRGGGARGGGRARRCASSLTTRLL